MQDVDGQVNQERDHRDDKDRALNGRVIEIQDRADRVFAEAAQREYELDRNGAAQQPTYEPKKQIVEQRMDDILSDPEKLERLEQSLTQPLD